MYNNYDNPNCYQCPYYNNCLCSFGNRNYYNSPDYFRTPQYNQFHPYSSNHPVESFRQPDLIFHEKFNIPMFGTTVEFRSRWDARRRSYVMEAWIGEMKILDEDFKIPEQDREFVAFTPSITTPLGAFRGKVVVGLAVSRGEAYYRLEGRFWTKAGTVHTVDIPGPSHRQVTKIANFKFPE